MIRRIRGLALAATPLFLGLAGTTLWMRATRPPVEGIQVQDPTSALLYTLGQVAFLLLGAAVIARRPDNPTGFCYLMVGVTGIAGGALLEYGIRGASTEGGLPLWREAAGLYYPTATPIMGWLILATLLFPNGRLLTRRWRFAVASVAVCFLAVVITSVALWPHRGPKVLGPAFAGDGVAAILWDLPYILFLPTLIAAAVSLILRFRRSRGEERLQVKWFVYALTMTVATTATLAVTGDPTDAPFAALAALSVPIAAGVAILKYRLHDIDVLINRTLVYVVLTGILGLIYIACVFAMQTVLAPVTQDSDLAIAASTLAVAALFGPVRSRVQGFIDARFYRRRYDAALALQDFSTRLRSEVELEVIHDDVLTVVARTVQPRHAQVWIGGAP